jgi:hypothetical protein
MTKTVRSGSESISQRHGSADPDPDQHQNVMDLEHCCKEWKTQAISSRQIKGYQTTIMRLCACVS